MSAAPEVFEITKAEFEDEVRAIAKDIVDETVADMAVEGMRKSKIDWESLDESEKAEAFKKAVSGELDSPKGKATQTGNKKGLWFLDGANDDYAPGSGHKFADVMPYLFKSKLETGRVDWRYVAKAANDGIEYRGRTIKNKTIGSEVEKALDAGTISGGGALIPENFSSDFIGFLYDSTVIRQMGARTVEMPGGSLDLGRMNQTATAYWVGENFSIEESEEKFGRLRLEAKKLGIIVVMSNDVLRRVPRGMEQIVRDDMTMVAQLKEDSAFIRGSGENGEPKGIANSIKSDNKFNQSGTSTADIIADLMKLIYKVRVANIPMSQAGYIFPVREHAYLLQLMDENSNLVSFVQQLSQGNLFGFNTFVSNQIPTNLGGDGDETEIYFGDASQCLIGESLNLRVDSFDSGTIGNANLVTDDQQALRLTHEVDFALRHDSAFAMTEQVTFGASLDA